MKLSQTDKDQHQRIREKRAIRINRNPNLPGIKPLKRDQIEFYRNFDIIKRGKSKFVKIEYPYQMELSQIEENILQF